MTVKAMPVSRAVSCGSRPWAAGGAEPAGEEGPQAFADVLVALSEGGDLGLQLFLQAEFGFVSGGVVEEEGAEGGPGVFVVGAGVQEGLPVLLFFRVRREEHGFLGGEVVEEGGAGDVGGTGDVFEADVVVAVFEDQVHGDLPDGAPGVELLAFPATGCSGDLHTGSIARTWTGVKIDESKFLRVERKARPRNQDY